MAIATDGLETANVATAGPNKAVTERTASAS